MPARLLLFCALLMASASSTGMTIYEITDDGRVTSYSDRPGPGAKPLVRRVPMVEMAEGRAAERDYLQRRRELLGAQPAACAGGGGVAPWTTW